MSTKSGHCLRYEKPGPVAFEGPNKVILYVQENKAKEPQDTGPRPEGHASEARTGRAARTAPSPDLPREQRQLLGHRDEDHPRRHVVIDGDRGMHGEHNRMDRFPECETCAKARWKHTAQRREEDSVRIVDVTRVFEKYNDPNREESEPEESLYQEPIAAKPAAPEPARSKRSSAWGSMAEGRRRGEAQPHATADEVREEESEVPRSAEESPTDQEATDSRTITERDSVPATSRESGSGTSARDSAPFTTSRESGPGTTSRESGPQTTSDSRPGTTERELIDSLPPGQTMVTIVDPLTDTSPETGGETPKDMDSLTTPSKRQGSKARRDNRLMDTTADTDVFDRAAQPGGDVGESDQSFNEEFERKMTEYMAEIDNNKEGIFANDEPHATRDMT